MINLGIIGYNKGNGHPISFSSIINGYNKKNLEKFCNYPFIIKYLKKNKNLKHIKNFKVKKIFTKNINISKRIAKISNIQYIAKNLKEMLDCDLILLLRDDLKDNDIIINYLLKHNKKIFIDKQISNNDKFLNSIKKKKLILLSGSAVPYSKEIINFKKNNKKKIEWIKAYCPRSWNRYGRHLLDPIIFLKKEKIKIIKIIKKNSLYDIIQIEFSDNSHAKMIFDKKNKFDLKILIKLQKSDRIVKLMIKDHFYMFKNMLKNLEKIYLEKLNFNNIFLSKLFLKITKKYELF